MKTAILAALALFVAMPGFARDSEHMFDIQSAMQANDAKNALGDEVKFYFGEQAHPEIERRVSEVTANRKTNAFGKSDLKACEWVFLSAMLALRDAALDRGANAVVNIESYYDKNAVSDMEQYECHAGNVVAGVVLKGNLVKLK